jgi:hypothetical protein
MQSRRVLFAALLAGVLVVALTAGGAQATPITPPRVDRPIPIINPGDAELQAWVNSIASLPSPAMVAHAEEVAWGTDHSSIVGHGPAKDEPASRNAWATGGVLRNDLNPGPFFETFDNWYGETWTFVPHKWGLYAYRGAKNVTFDREQVHKDEKPYDGSYSLKIASNVPFEAGAARTFNVTPGAEVVVEVMYLLYDHGGKHGGNVWTYDWAALGVKADDNDAVWVNGPNHGQWLPLRSPAVTAGPEGRMMVFLQVHSPLAENTNAYFDNVRVWVNGQPYTE